MGQKYLRMKDHKHPGLVRKEDVAKGEGLEPKLMFFKIFVKLWKRGEETYVTQTIADGGLGSGSPEAGGYGRILFNFYNFLEKIAILMPF